MDAKNRKSWRWRMFGFPIISCDLIKHQKDFSEIAVESHRRFSKIENLIFSFFHCFFITIFVASKKIWHKNLNRIERPTRRRQKMHSNLFLVCKFLKHIQSVAWPLPWTCFIIAPIVYLRQTLDQFIFQFLISFQIDIYPQSWY